MIHPKISILSILAQNPELAPEIRHLNPHEFKDDSGRNLKLPEVYEELLNLIDLKIAIEPVLVARNANLPVSFVKKVFENTEYKLENLPVYLEEVRRDTIRQELKKYAVEVGELVQDSELTNEQLLFDIQTKTKNLTSKDAHAADLNRADFDNHLDKYLLKVETEKDLALEERGIITPFTLFNNMFGVLPYGDYTIIAADTGVGKTAYIGDIVMNALRNGKHVASFVLEMSEEQIIQRQISKLAGLSMRQLREMSFYHDPVQKTNFFNAVNTLKNHGENWHIFGTETTEITEIINMVRRLNALHDISLTTIDYLQLLRYKEFKHDRVLEVGFASQALASLAKEINCHVIAAAQLNRNLSNRADLRPRLSDLKDSSYIEQSADAVKFLYRDGYYHSDSPNPNIAEVNIAKGRNIGTGMFKLFWDGPHTTFKNLVDEEDYIF